MGVMWPERYSDILSFYPYSTQLGCILGFSVFWPIRAHRSNVVRGPSLSGFGVSKTSEIGSHAALYKTRREAREREAANLTPHGGMARRCPTKGPSIYDIRIIFRCVDPLLPLVHAEQPVYTT